MSRSGQEVLVPATIAMLAGRVDGPWKPPHPSEDDEVVGGITACRSQARSLGDLSVVAGMVRGVGTECSGNLPHYGGSGGVLQNDDRRQGRHQLDLIMAGVVHELGPPTRS